MSSFSVKASSAWRTVDPYVKASGSWRAVQSGWIRVSGTWRQFYSRLVIAFSDQTLGDTTFSSPCLCSYVLNSSGKAQQTLISGTTDLEDYVTPTSSAAALEVMVTSSGSALDGGSSATGSYLPLTSSRAWSISRASFGSDSTDLTVTIREVANTSNSVTRTVSMSIEVF